MTGERTISMGQAIREGLIAAAAADRSILVMTEGVTDPSAFYGTTKGIEDHVERARLIELPISENGMMGVAVGAALAGKRPVINLQRVEFVLLAMEQLLNNAAKAHYVSNGRHRVPLVLRMVVGRGWGQGPEHSQSLEAIFAHVPGLKVVMPALPADGKGLLLAAIADDNPVVIIEHRWCHYATGVVPDGLYQTPLDGPKVIRQGRDVTIVATSYMTLEAMRAADALAEIGCAAEVVDMRVIRPLNIEPIAASVAKTGRLITVDTGFRMFGIGAEVSAQVVERCFGALKAAPVRLGLPDHPTPSSRGMVTGFYPDAMGIVREAGGMLGLDAGKVEAAVAGIEARRQGLPVDVPDPSFKGPF